MGQSSIVAMIGGLVSAVLYGSVLGGSLGALILAYLTPLPLFLVGLGFGVQPAIVAAASGTLFVMATSGSPVATLVFALGNGLPVWFLVSQALRSRAWEGGTAWYPPGLLLCHLAAAGATLLLFTFVATLGAERGLLGLSERFIAETIGAVPGPGLVAPDSSDLVGLLSPIFPGGVVFSWMLMLIVNGLLAQGLLSRFERAIRPGMTMTEMDFPQWVSAAFAISMACGVLLPGHIGYLGTNLAIVLTLPLFFGGLAVVHAYADARPGRRSLLVGFYVVLALFGWPVIAIVVLGFADQWVNLRRMSSSGPSGRGGV